MQQLKVGDCVVVRAQGAPAAGKVVSIISRTKNPKTIEIGIVFDEDRYNVHVIPLGEGREEVWGRLMYVGAFVESCFFINGKVFRPDKYEDGFLGILE